MFLHHVTVLACLLVSSVTCQTSTCQLMTPTPTMLDGFEPFLRDGQCFRIVVKGNTYGFVWGSDVYKLDSSLSAAAVHAGVLAPGEIKTVRVQVLEDQTFGSSTRNGVSGSSWPLGGTGFRFVGVEEGVPELPAGSGTTGCMPMRPTPSILRDFLLYWRACFEVSVTGDREGGMVWGTDVYTADSALSAAAVHAGILAQGETGTVRVQMLPYREEYEGSARNGVETYSYGFYGTSFKFLDQP